MFKYYILIIGLWLTSLSLAAQDKVTLSGQLNDEKGNPLEYATVSLEGTRFGATTDGNGVFNIKNIPNGKYTLRVSSIGYQSFKEEITVNGNNPEFMLTIKEDVFQLPQLTIIANKDRIFSSVPGSVGYIDSKEISRIQPISGNEIFRRVAGVHVVDEEGTGMRVNIGIRGLDPDRSRSVLVMEDGVPVALNPYGEPEMYYTPAIDRMVGVEVLKGSGQILYGPQTVGGVVNYITADPPEEQQVGLRLQGGQGNMFTGLLSYGNTFGNAGVQVNYLRKQAEQVGNAGYDIHDFSGKVKLLTGNKGALGIKFGMYNETSNATYVGITQDMYEKGGNDFSILAPNDELAVNRYSLSLNHHQEISKNIKLQSTLYGFNTTRNWRRQDFVYSDGNGTRPNDFSGLVWGDESVANGAILFRNRTGNRNRQFEVLGFEQKLVLNSQLGSMNNELNVGYRLMHERAYEQRINGTDPEARSGALVSDEIRTGRAVSFYALDKIRPNDRLEFSAGLRAEIYNFERDILRNASIDTNMVATNTVTEIIPGVGFNYRFTRNYNLFGGLHRGYAPPRVKDALDFSYENPVLELDAERSWNYELGIRTTPFKGVFVEMTAFYMDFENQIIPVSESAGGVGFGFTNAGRTVHSGLEMALNANSKDMFSTDWTFALDLNASFINAVYAADRFKMVGGEEVNINGNRTPYAPNFISSAAISIEAPFMTGLRFTNTYVGNQFTDELNTVAPSANGRIGQMDAYNVMDLTLYQAVPKWKTAFNLSVKNLTNERYVTTRRPQGIRVGLPRYISAGVEIKI